MLRADTVTAELREGLFQQVLLEKRCRDLVPVSAFVPSPRDAPAVSSLAPSLPLPRELWGERSPSAPPGRGRGRDAAEVPGGAGGARGGRYSVQTETLG